MTSTGVAGFRSGRTVSDVLGWSRDLVDPALRAAVATIPGSMRHIAGYHLGWWDAHGRPIDGECGKGIRPALALLAAAAVGGDAVSAVPAATAVELVHNHSLVHDDVMDGDETRRHRPTAWAVFGVNQAIQAGDALLSLAFGVLGGSRHPSAQRGTQLLNESVLSLVDGQAMDLAFERRSVIGVSECVRMAEAKTGALMAGACALGALFGGGGPEQVEHLRTFGAHLGLAFQHVDDLLGIWGRPAVTGKTVHSDLYRRKKSLPVVAALTAETPEGRELAARYRRGDQLSTVEVSELAELVDRAGGRAWSQRQADDLVATALRHLRSAHLLPRAADELDALARLVTRRDH